MSDVPLPSAPWPARARRSLHAMAAIVAIHGLLLWGLVRSTAWQEAKQTIAPLFVQLLAAPAALRAQPEPQRLRAPGQAPRSVVAPVPLLAERSSPVTATIERIEAHTEVAIVDATAPGPALPAPIVAVAPRAPSPERQIAITQVEYLAPPVLAYPLAARRLREQGEVQVRVRVDEQGRPERALVLRSSGSDRLDEAALATVRATRFKPYTEDGVARAFWVVMPLVFQLDT